MAIQDVTTRTISCDNKGCDKSLKFDPANQEEVAALPDWLRTTRSVSLGNGQRFTYCSDVCEVQGVTTGQHNVPEPPKVQPANEGDLRRAVVEAKVTEAMKAKQAEGKVTLS